MNTTDTQLHDMIQPTCEEYYDDDKYGMSRAMDDQMDDNATYQLEEGGL